jgi:hypothetical protein
MRRQQSDYYNHDSKNSKGGYNDPYEDPFNTPFERWQQDQRMNPFHPVRVIEKMIRLVILYMFMLVIWRILFGKRSKREEF